jgi:hypothetical protein
MAMETDPDKINDRDRQLQQSILREGQSYAARNARSKAENKGRAESRAKIKELGMDPNAFHTAAGLVKRFTPTQLKDWLRDFNTTMDVLTAQQAELFPEELAAARKREDAAKQRESAKVTGKEGAPDPDTNPRSDPKRGGAGKGKGSRKAADAEEVGEVPWPDDVAAARPDEMAAGVIHEPGTNGTPPDVPGEQAEGEAALAAAMPKTKKAQSAIAAEKLQAAKLN